MTHDHVGVALIGYGYAGRVFHAPLIRATPGLDLACISSSRPDLVHADLPGIPVVSSPHEAWSLPSVQVVVIATPNDSHLAIATTALQDEKHVVVEKPLAPTLDEARALSSLAHRAGCLLAVFQNRRWDGDYLAVTDLLARGTLGKVTHFESHFDRFRPRVRDRWREQAGAGSGVWYDLGPHLVDQALQLFGLPDRVTASMAAQRDGAQSHDWAHVILEYDRLRVVLHASVLAAAPLPRFIVHGDRGSWIKYGLDAQERQLNAGSSRDAAAPVPEAEHALLVDGTDGSATETPVPRGNYGEFYRRILDAVMGTGPNPVPAEDALPVTALIEVAIRSSAEGRTLGLPLTADEIRGFER